MTRLVQCVAEWPPAMKTEQEKPSPDETGVVVPFPARKATPVRAFSNLSHDYSPVEGVDKYEQRSDDPDDYAHRMKMNALAIVFLAALVGGGIWIVDVMAQQRRKSGLRADRAARLRDDQYPDGRKIVRIPARPREPGISRRAKPRIGVMRTGAVPLRSWAVLDISATAKQDRS